VKKGTHDLSVLVTSLTAFQLYLFSKQMNVVVVVDLFYCPYAQSICCSGDFRVKTDECIHFTVGNTRC